jgi:RNA polymerase subunit RPABC4/transcription elongation factor Spt4
MDERWALLTGFKDLLTYVMSAGMITEAPSLAQTVDGLRLLAKAGLLTESKDKYGLTPGLERLVWLTAGMEAGIQWQRATLLESGEIVMTNRMFLFGDKSLILTIIPMPDKKVFIARVRRKEIIDFITSEIMGSASDTGIYVPPAKQAAAPVKETPVRQTPSPQVRTAPPVQQAQPVAKTIPPPVQQAPPQSRPVVSPPQQPVSAPVTAPVSGAACARCGTALKPGAKFCPKCGTPVPVAPVAAAGAKFCPKCGTGITPGVKFCPKCGAKLG